MTEYVYIDISRIPRPLVDTAACRDDGEQKHIAFIGCAIVGIEQDSGEVQFPWPSPGELREELEKWLDYWSIPYRVDR
ncbi:hypothetical protein [Caballeronia sp. LZ035]|uniref:hypothetical protein n=1 Tax=Caballeronia sp. LZ035 TaxID=3038568 RepID=UPI002856862C|nr:hypothetical protein [Caballeronia sp. LZ035]MDR5761942.1 hypothetical protein [Caballeronia sp. LZ035]